MRWAVAAWMNEIKGRLTNTGYNCLLLFMSWIKWKYVIANSFLIYEYLLKSYLVLHWITFSKMVGTEYFPLVNAHAFECFPLVTVVMYWRQVECNCYGSFSIYSRQLNVDSKAALWSVPMPYGVGFHVALEMRCLSHAVVCLYFLLTLCIFISEVPCHCCCLLA